MNCRALVVIAAAVICVSPAFPAGASAPADRSAASSPVSLSRGPTPPLDDGPLRTRGAFSGPDENDDTEPDDVFVRPTTRLARGATTSPSGVSGSAATAGGGGRSGGGKALRDLPSANECLADVLEKVRGREVNVALLGSHKYMLAGCLGVKVSAGQFKLRFDNPTLSFVSGKVVFECGIDHVSFSAFKLRFKPNVENPLKLCEFSKKHSVGGKADDIRLKIVFDPIISDDGCEVRSLGAVDVTVRIGDINMSGVQNDLEKACNNMVEDALSVFLDYQLSVDLGFMMHHFLQAGCGIVPSNESGGGNKGGSSSGDSDLAQRVAELEDRVAALEERFGNSSAASAATAPARSAPAETDRAASPTRTPEVAARTNPRAAPPAGAFQIVPNSALKGRLGRIVVTYPTGTNDLKSRAETFKAGETKGLRTDYGDFVIEMPPGSYDLNIGGRLVTGIIVESRSDTQVHVGVLRLNASGETRFEIFEPGQKRSAGTYYGQTDVGLPPGSYEIDVNGQRETVTVTAGVITDF